MTKIPTLRVYVCPECKKHRMLRPDGYIISIQQEYSLDKTKTRFRDVCDACLRKHYKEDLKYKETKGVVAKEAIKNKEKMPDGVSLEDGLI